MLLRSERAAIVGAQNAGRTMLSPLRCGSATAAEAAPRLALTSAMLACDSCHALLARGWRGGVEWPTGSAVVTVLRAGASATTV
jgi:hypothetical protein